MRKWKWMILINEPVCDGSDDDLGIDLDSEDEER